MGWANDAFTNELARSGIFPMRSEEIGNCRETVRKTIKKAMKTYNYDFPTEAQVRALHFITKNTGVIFEGRTKNSARDFINEYMDYAREECKK
jgi:hypothetical protein